MKTQTDPRATLPLFKEPEFQPKERLPRIKPLPNVPAKERLHTAGGGTACVCSICGSKEGLPHNRKGLIVVGMDKKTGEEKTEFVHLTPFNTRNGRVWCCQVCAEFTKSRGYKPA